MKTKALLRVWGKWLLGLVCPRCGRVFSEEYPRGEYWCEECNTSYMYSEGVERWLEV